MNNLREAETREILQSTQRGIRQEDTLVVRRRVVRIRIVIQMIDVGNPRGDLRIWPQREIESKSAHADLVETGEQAATEGRAHQNVADVHRGCSAEQIAQIETCGAGRLVLN